MSIVSCNFLCIGTLKHVAVHKNNIKNSSVVDAVDDSAMIQYTPEASVLTRKAETNIGIAFVIAVVNLLPNAFFNRLLFLRMEQIPKMSV